MLTIKSIVSPNFDVFNSEINLYRIKEYSKKYNMYNMPNSLSIGNILNKIKSKDIFENQLVFSTFDCLYHIRFHLSHYFHLYA